MLYTSTRNSEIKIKDYEAILKGISDDKGLFVPTELPKFSFEEIKALSNKSYSQAAAFVISRICDNFSIEQLEMLAKSAYDSFDGIKSSGEADAAPLHKLDDTSSVLELWHGPTAAFKDIALQLMPRLFFASKQKAGNNKTTLIIVATSGDTGKAALEGFCDVEGIKIAVMYPRHGVSETQRLQMATQKGNNVFVAGIEGNFDDAQRIAKKLMTDNSFIDSMKRQNIELSSANSINWGRLVPQIVYYFWSYSKLLEQKTISRGDKLNFCVPSGNFGNILAGYYAKLMGVPINKLISASNINDVLYDFINSGEYASKRGFHKTISPSMDILVSSNIERLLYLISDGNTKDVARYLESLEQNGSYRVSSEQMQTIKQNFFGYRCDEQQTEAEMKRVYKSFGYLIDPHTAVATNAYEQYKEETKDTTHTVIVSTASPFKFSESVIKAVFDHDEQYSDAVKTLEKLSEITAPECLRGLTEKQIRFEGCYKEQEIEPLFFEFIK